MLRLRSGLLMGDSLGIRVRRRRGIRIGIGIWEEKCEREVRWTE